MKRRKIAAAACLLAAALLTGCGTSSAEQENSETSVVAETKISAETAAPEATEAAKETEATMEKQEQALPDGVYTADFDTDSGMFHVSEACEGKGTLTVEDGVMSIHISLGSKNILNLYPGLAEDAQKEGAELLQPTEDTVTYSDGLSETVYGFDVPVPALDEEFDLALKKRKMV